MDSLIDAMNLTKAEETLLFGVFFVAIGLFYAVDLPRAALRRRREASGPFNISRDGRWLTPRTGVVEKLRTFWDWVVVRLLPAAIAAAGLVAIGVGISQLAVFD